MNIVTWGLREAAWRPPVIRCLLAILNSRLINRTPCKYGFIGNVNAFSIENLRAEVSARPDLTVAQLLGEAEAFASCRIDPEGLTVIEAGVAREATCWDVHQLRLALAQAEKRSGKDGACNDR